MYDGDGLRLQCVGCRCELLALLRAEKEGNCAEQAKCNRDEEKESQVTSPGIGR
jgi:hypothetical protein